ncbi:hypothetical protein [Sulfitobacter sp. 20_GPM-1509m]|nr:hypothetical protein [Sulfitobacter sp. 20_GPM-1509m]
MTAQFAHWTRDDIARAFDVHRFTMCRIARMTGLSVHEVKRKLGGGQ